MREKHEKRSPSMLVSKGSQKELKIKELKTLEEFKEIWQQCTQNILLNLIDTVKIGLKKI